MPAKKRKKTVKKPAFHYNNHQLSLGQRSADKLTEFVGSWAFIIGILIFMAIWIAINTMMIIFKWDPYPYILLNFVLSCLAAIQAPIILMSQNREAEKDRHRVEYDYKVNRKAEREITSIQEELKLIKKMMKKQK